jgi:hypothetical protein
MKYVWLAAIAILLSAGAADAMTYKDIARNFSQQLWQLREVHRNPPRNEKRPPDWRSRWPSLSITMTAFLSEHGN